MHVVAEPASPCLDRAAFERALFARITRPRGRGAEGETKVLVRVDAESRGFAGHVTIVEPSEQPRERVVHGASCDHVALSMVLVAALALGGEPEADPDRVVTREPADDALAVGPPPPPGAPTVVPWTVLVGAHGSLAAAGAGEASLSGDLFGELSSRRSGLSPGLRVALAYGAAARSEGAITMHLSTVTARLEPSLLRVEAGPVAARLALSLEGGVALARAVGTTRDDSVTRPWLRAGAQAEVAMKAIGPIGLELSGGALVAVVRDDFVVDPAGFGLRVPVVAPVGRFGFFVQFQ